MNRKDVSHHCAPLFIDGKPIDTSSFTATEAKNDFGQVLEMAIQGRAIVITKHDSRKAVIISYEDFQNIAERGERQLKALRAEFDDLLSSMQTPKTQAGIKAAFNASPKQLGLAAVVTKNKRS